MIYLKLTWGYVAQRYDSDTGDCVQQEFIPDASQTPQRQDEGGNPISEAEQVEMGNTEKEPAMDMVQP